MNSFDHDRLFFEAGLARLDDKMHHILLPRYDTHGKRKLQLARKSKAGASTTKGKYYAYDLYKTALGHMGVFGVHTRRPIWE